MSVETYSSYEISPAERARLERERQQRLEEERRRLEEERRQRIIRNQKALVAYAADYETLARRLHNGALRDRIIRLQMLTDAHCDVRLRDRVKTLAWAIGALENEGNIPSDLEEEIARLEREVSTIRAGERAAEKEEQGTQPTSEQMTALLQSVRSAYALIIKTESGAERILRIIAAAESELPSNSRFHHSKLRMAELELLHMAERIAKRLAQENRETDRLKTSIDQWIPRLRALERCAHLNQDRARAGDLARQLEVLEGEEAGHRWNAVAAEMMKEAEELELEIREADENLEARRLVMAAVESSLSAMGYEVEVLNKPAEDASTEVESITALTPDEECVVGTFGLNRSFHFQFKHVVDAAEASGQIDQTALNESCANWCQHQPELRERLRKKGITAVSKWEVPPGKGEVTVHVDDVAKRDKRARRRRDRRGRRSRDL